MERDGSKPAVRDRPWDRIASELQALRLRSGEPSYAELSRRIAERRIAEGIEPYAARVARSTVYDTFRGGRTRGNLELVREVAQALGSAPDVVDAWLVETPDVTPESTAPEAQAVPRAPMLQPTPEPVTAKVQVLLMLACVVVNLLGREFIDFFAFPIYLDMVGTAVAAMALGPWRGAAVGLATNALGVVGSGWISLPFAIVNIVGALMWGYGVRRFGLGRSLPRFFALNMATAGACSLVAVPVIVTFLGGRAGIGHDVITQLVQESVDTFIVAVGFSNLLTSAADKLISGFLALVVISALPLMLRRDSGLVLCDPEASDPPRRDGPQA